MVVAHCQGFASHRVLVASRGTLPLEALVREVTGECHPVFALSLGTEMRFRKLTVQVMRPEGEILAYIKLPLTGAAAERVRHEAETLNHLWSFPALRLHIPRVLYSGEWGCGAILFQSGGPSRPGPVLFSRQCQEFLRLLGGIQTSEKSGQILWEEVAARWSKAEPSLSSGWRALGQAALAKAKRESTVLWSDAASRTAISLRGTRARETGACTSLTGSPLPGRRRPHGTSSTSKLKWQLC